MRKDRIARTFRPTLDGLESRMVLSGAAAHHVAAATVSARSDLNAGVLAFANSKLGSKVGSGQCTDLAQQAIASVNGKPFNLLGPTGANADYVWGNLVATITPTSTSTAGIRAGDIIQYRNVVESVTTKVVQPNGAWTSSTSTYTYAHHTAVVTAVGGSFLAVDQQNVNGVMIDQQGLSWAGSQTLTGTNALGVKTSTTYTMTGGTMWVYRAHT